MEKIEGPSHHIVFGSLLAKPPTDRLWTKLETVNYVRYLKSTSGKTKFSSNDLQQLYKGVASTMLSVYHQAFMPTYNLEYSTKIIRKDIETELRDVRVNKSKFKNETFRNSWLKKLDTMYHFSIRCTCFVNAISTEDIKRTSCSCKASNKIPSLLTYGAFKFDRTKTIDLICEEDKQYIKDFMAGKLDFNFLIVMITINVRKSARAAEIKGCSTIKSP